jgi:sugar O-acyltransferase (sialic acid O-acetyltransferase NeuD family)
MKIGLIGYGELGKQFEHFIAQSFSSYQFIYFDDIANTNKINNAKPFKDYLNPEYKEVFFLIALGYKYLETKNNILEELIKNKRKQYTFIHKTAIIDSTARIGSGTVIYPNVVIDKNVRIGQSVVLNLSVNVAHDSEINDSCFIGPAAVMNGFSKIGTRCFIGSNSTIIDNLSIADDVKIGAGSVVTNNITERGVYFGVPARKKN